MSDLGKQNEAVDTVVGHYATTLMVMAAFGTLIGFLVAASLGETYNVIVEHNDFSGERQVGTSHYPDDGGFTTNKIRLTHTGGKWVGGGAGVGAALGLLFAFIYRNFWMGPASDTSSKATAGYDSSYDKTIGTMTGREPLSNGT